MTTRRVVFFRERLWNIVSRVEGVESSLKKWYKRPKNPEVNFDHPRYTYLLLRWCTNAAGIRAFHFKPRKRQDQKEGSKEENVAENDWSGG